MWFRSSVPVASVLTAVAWIWTAWEVDNLNIEAIDRFTKAFAFEPWLLAAVLIPLTVAWMPKNLPVRALTGIMMLMPAALFRTTRAYLPPAGTWFAAVDIFTYVAYVSAILGMYGMFYPWRLEKGLDLVFSRPFATRLLGAATAIAGTALIVTGICL
ncbi:MAG: hypothetical protein K6F50_08360 [Kiritimatiellae bacterium]|nr:hypothetical protein [Kiritimatiellia bacterium]